MKKVSKCAAIVCTLLTLAGLAEAQGNADVNTKAQVSSWTLRTETMIPGMPEVNKQQCVNYLKKHNLTPKLTVSVEELVDYYYEEAAIEGIRGDIAFSQAILETGHFRYGGDVLPEQNNYAGIGTTGSGVKGVWFPTARIGVRAHIQHLLAYSTTRPPFTEIVNPRYEFVKTMPDRFGKCQTWESLNGKWAVPGFDYGQKILKIHQRIKTTTL